MEIFIEWDEEDINHIRKHNVSPREVESIFESKIFYKRRKGYYDILGKTDSGRFLFVVLDRLGANVYRVAIARDASDSEKDLYVRRAK